ncbi:hypothetical protein BG011_002938 [Mortierella polycephala]|uniref:AMP-dependent synthetase/ligase domain-containing protein n=1 Tax=Mortierella polycephala TaxID=41804 RepID=A0A9P6QFR8_9FUNG|nr:hypothetical protein BG011_002938 [Mortierella polycephala]
MPTFVNSYSLEKQSVEIPDTRSHGATGHYRHAGYADGLVDRIRGAPHIKTIYDIFQAWKRPYDCSTKTYGGYEWQTYCQVDKRVNAFGSGIMHLNEVILGNAKLDRWSLGIWSLNRPEWFTAEMSCNYYNLVSVPLYDTLGPDAIEYVINHAEIPITVCSANHIPTLLQAAAKYPGLKAIVCMDTLSESGAVPVPGGLNAVHVLRTWAAEKGIKLFYFDEIESLGVKYPRKHIPPKDDDAATFCYTSGTTGEPVTFLPLAHIMGRSVDLIAAFSGCRLGYFRGDMLLLMDDLAELKPTYFVAVPRLLNRIYAKIVAATVDAPGVIGVLASSGFAAKVANLEAGKGVHHPFWDRLLFNKIKMALGGRVEVILTGAAPIAKEILNFLRVALGCEIIEAYGSTEALAVGIYTLPGEYIPGHVGCPRAGCEVKLVDVPDKDYLATDMPYPRGEIQIRGSGVFKGYFKDDEKTREAIDSEGWLATGDIGYVDDRGCFTIIDRKKNIFKLSQGEYIAPEKIENILAARCKLILQICIQGDTLESTLVAVSIPDPETFLPFANVIAGTSAILGDNDAFVELCKDPRVNAAYLQELEKAGRDGGLKGFELVKRVHLTTDAFSVENSMMTPTFKVRRPQVSDHYKGQIRAMYADIHATPT